MIYGGVELYNVHELLDDESGEAKGFTRIPNDLRLKLNESAGRNALQTTGCEVRFSLKSDSAKIVLQSTERSSIVEVYQGCFFMAWHTVGLEPTEIPVQLPERIDELDRLTQEHGLPFDARLIRVALPWRPPAKLIAIEGSFDLPRPEQTPATRYLAYGSSITHGNSAIRPTGCWARRTAQNLGVDLINLGFGGGAHLEREMADYIAGRSDWDFATLEMGINIIGSIDEDEFARRVDYFVTTIAQAHPDKWIFCIDLFTCRYDFEGRDLRPSDKIVAFRGIVGDKVAQLNLPKLVHVSGSDILTSVDGLTADLVHPSPHGMEEMATNMTRLIGSRIG